MSTTLQADEKGNLQLHSSLLPKPDPHATYNIREQNGSLLTSRETIDTPENEASWKTATPEERARAFEEWVKKAATPGRIIGLCRQQKRHVRLMQLL